MYGTQEAPSVARTVGHFAIGLVLGLLVLPLSILVAPLFGPLVLVLPFVLVASAVTMRPKNTPRSIGVAVGALTTMPFLLAMVLIGSDY